MPPDDDPLFKAPGKFARPLNPMPNGNPASVSALICNLQTCHVATASGEKSIQCSSRRHFWRRCPLRSLGRDARATRAVGKTILAF